MLACFNLTNRQRQPLIISGRKCYCTLAKGRRGFCSAVCLFIVAGAGNLEKVVFPAACYLRALGCLHWGWTPVPPHYFLRRSLEEVCIHLSTPTNQPTLSDNRHYQLRADEPEIANQPKSGGTAPTIISPRAGPSAAWIWFILVISRKSFVPEFTLTVNAKRQRLTCCASPAAPPRSPFIDRQRPRLARLFCHRENLISRVCLMHFQNWEFNSNRNS